MMSRCRASSPRWMHFIDCKYIFYVSKGCKVDILDAGETLKKKENQPNRLAVLVNLCSLLIALIWDCYADTVSTCEAMHKMKRIQPF